MTTSEKYDEILGALADVLKAKNNAIMLLQYQVDALNEKLDEIEKENKKNEAV